MTARQLLPAAAYVAEVAVFAVVAWFAAWPIHSPAVSIATGVTAAWFAGMFLPCPCHRATSRRTTSNGDRT
ncbi:hypothetical protein [Streptomyces sp. NPDC001492]